MKTSDKKLLKKGIKEFIALSLSRGYAVTKAEISLMRTRMKRLIKRSRG